MNTKPLALIGTLTLVLAGCGNSRELVYKNVQIKELERQNAELEAQLAARGATPFVMPGAEPTTGRIGDIDFSTRDRDIVMTISNEVLFKPGSAVLSDKAKKVLDEAISQIKSKFPNAAVRVEGHTDDQVIKRSKDENKDNWDLSGNRGQAVLHYLLDHGIAAKQLGFAGYGMERPVASNATNEGKAKNRRVEIVVITNK